MHHPTTLFWLEIPRAKTKFHYTRVQKAFWTSNSSRTSISIWCQLGLTPMLSRLRSRMIQPRHLDFCRIVGMDLVTLMNPISQGIKTHQNYWALNRNLSQTISKTSSRKVKIPIPTKPSSQSWTRAQPYNNMGLAARTRSLSSSLQTSRGQ